MASPKQHCVCVCVDDRKPTAQPIFSESWGRPLVIDNGKDESFPSLCCCPRCSLQAGMGLLMKSTLYGAGTTNGVPFTSTSTATIGASIFPVSIIRCVRGMDWRCNKSLISFVTLWHFGHLCLGSVAFWGCLHGFSFAVGHWQTQLKANEGRFPYRVYGVRLQDDHGMWAWVRNTHTHLTRLTDCTWITAQKCWISRIEITFNFA